MSIATELEALNTNLTAAKAAVTAKGGTVGDTGLAGLATEIASIPAGGGGETFYQTPYGRIWLAPFAFSVTEEYADGCSLVIDSNKVIDFLGKHELSQDDNPIRIDFYYDNGNWQSYAFSGEPSLTTAELADQFGVTVTIDSGAEYPSFTLSVEATVSQSGEWSKADLTLSDIDSWYSQYSWNSSTYHKVVGEKIIPTAALRRFEFGSENQTMSFNFQNGFLDGSAVQEIGEIPDNISGTLVLSNLTLNSVISGGKNLSVLGVTGCSCAGVVFYPNASQETLSPDLRIGRGSNYGVQEWNFPVVTGPNVKSATIEASTAFNQPLIIQGGGYVNVRNLTTFNQPIIFSEGITRITFNDNKAFNQDVKLPSTLIALQSANVWFFRNCDNMTGTINVGNLSPNVIGNANQAFSSTNANAACYTTGIKIAGANRQAWLNAFPNSNSSPYRKLIDAGY